MTEGESNGREVEFRAGTVFPKALYTGSGDFEHKIVVGAPKNINAALRVGVMNGGYHEWIAEKLFPELQKGEVVFYGARFGLVPSAENSNEFTLIINGDSLAYRTIPEGMGLVVCRKLSELLKAKRTSPSWNDVDWQAIGTQLPPSRELKVERLP